MIGFGADTGGAINLEKRVWSSDFVFLGRSHFLYLLFTDLFYFTIGGNCETFLELLIGDIVKGHFSYFFIGKVVFDV